MPIRKHADVMRIYISPWVDADDDLHADGYIYTDIDSPKWNLGGRFVAPKAGNIKPLTK